MQHIKHIQRITPTLTATSSLDQKPVNRFSQPILKDGLVLEDIMAENEAKRKNESKIDEFKNLCKSQNIREIRKFIKRNDIINSLNTRELNEDFPINEHRFVKRNGLLTLIHDPNISTSKEPVPCDFEPSDNEDTYNIAQAVRTDEPLNLESLNEKVNKFYDFCTQVQNFLIQQYS